MATKNSAIIHMVPSSHWDREWYLPFRRFQVRLVRLMDKIISLLESQKYEHFLLDGQTIMLEDYLEVKPWMGKRIQKLVREGKLIIGPWYVVPDTFIPSGESLWKNLEIGSEIMAEFGGNTQVGYTPDSFGITGQLPQIFAHHGLKNVVYTRGQRFENEQDNDKYSTESFVAPDKTALLSEYTSYSLGLGFVVPTCWRNFAKLQVTPEDAVRTMQDWLLEHQAARSPYKNRLLICGIDHIEPRENFPELIDALNEAIPNVTFICSSPDAYFNALAAEVYTDGKTALPQVFGEQRGAYKEHFVLGNTLSSRIDIKMLNREVENLLFNYLPALDLYNKPCDSFDLLDKDALMKTAERELIKAHPHDSICTCSVDETNSDVMARLNGAKQIGEELLKDDLLKIGSSMKVLNEKGAILVYNCLPYPRTMLVEGKLTIPYEVDGTCLCEDGKVVEGAEVKVLFHKRLDIESSKYVSFEEISRDETRDVILENGTGADLQTGISYRFVADNVPPMGFKCYYLGKHQPEAQSPVTDQGRIIENDYTRVSVNEDGSVEITSKCLGVTLSRANRMEISVDTGDEYTYSNPDNLVCTAEHARVLSRTVNTNMQELTVSYNITKPGGEAEKIGVTSVLRLTRDSAAVQIRTTIDNADEEFRIRALFHSEGNPDFAYSDTAFDFTSRPVYHTSKLQPKNIMTMPCRNLVYVPAEGYGMALYSKSSHEFETVKDEEGSITALTLLRSVRKVYATDCATRDETFMGVGTRWHTEDGKMQGTTLLDYAVEITPPDVDALTLTNKALSYQLPLYCRGIAPEGEFTPSALSAQNGFTLSGAVFSRVEKKKGEMFIRMYNPLDTETTAVISTKSYKAKEIHLEAKKIATIKMY